MAISIGSTAVWNSSILFPTEDCSEDDESYNKSNAIIEQSIETWKKIPISSNVASVHASYPRKGESDDDNSISSDSYFYIENEKEEIKMESDSYSIESNDERKRPARPTIKAHRQLNIIQEEEVERDLAPSTVVNQREEGEITI